MYHQSNLLPSFSLIAALNQPNLKSASLKVLEFLDLQSLQIMAQAFEHYQEPSFFIQLIKTYTFIASFLNKTDRAMYYTFYDEKQFHAVENHNIANISQSYSQEFLKFPSQYRQILNFMKNSLPAAAGDIDGIKSMLADPDLPIPKLKRETVGMFCNSPFQVFLVDTKFGMKEEEVFTLFEEIQSYFNFEKEEKYIKSFMLIAKEKHHSSEDLKKIMQVRFTGYEINALNYQQFLLSQNELHNFIVGLFALTQVFIESTHKYLSCIDDPLHKFVELMLRYSIFRNFVLAVQENLAFVFEMYGSIYADSVKESAGKPKYQFWRPAMTKWFLKFEHLHETSSKIYSLSLIKLRSNHLLEFLEENKHSIDYYTYILVYNRVLKNKLEMREFELLLSEEVYGSCMNSQESIGNYFDQNKQLYQIIIMEFMEYMVDMSINEQTVHWCGYSSHSLEIPYKNFEKIFLKYNRDYYVDVLGQLSKKVVNREQIKQILDSELSYMEHQLQIKPVTLKKIVDEMMMEYKLEDEMSEGNDQIFSIDFNERDKKLEYFNHKAFILSEMDEEEKPFFSIPPLCSPQEILIKSIDTNDSDNNYEKTDQELYQYFSEEEESQQYVSDLEQKQHSQEELNHKNNKPLKINQGKTDSKEKTERKNKELKLNSQKIFEEDKLEGDSVDETAQKEKKSKNLQQEKKIEESTSKT